MKWSTRPTAETARSGGEGRSFRDWFSPGNRRQQLLAFIITRQEKSAEISQSILNSLHRGVTEISGRGMYTGEDRAILMCALTVTEINNFKTVAKVDPTAFVITSSASEILGRGFQPLSREE